MSDLLHVEAKALRPVQPRFQSRSMRTGSSMKLFAMSQESHLQLLGRGASRLELTNFFQFHLEAAR